MDDPVVRRTQVMERISTIRNKQLPQIKYLPILWLQKVHGQTFHLSLPNFYFSPTPGITPVKLEVLDLIKGCIQEAIRVQL